MPPLPPPPPPPTPQSAPGAKARDTLAPRCPVPPRRRPTRQNTSPASLPSASECVELASPILATRPGLLSSPPLAAPLVPAHHAGAGAWADVSAARPPTPSHGCASPTAPFPAPNNLALFPFEARSDTGSDVLPAHLGSASGLGHLSEPDSDTDSDLPDLRSAGLRLSLLSPETDWEGSAPNTPTRSKRTATGSVGLGIMSWPDGSSPAADSHAGLLGPVAPLPMPSTSPRIRPSRWTAPGWSAHAGLRRRAPPPAKPLEKRPPRPHPPRRAVAPWWWILLPLLVVLALFMPRAGQDVAWRLDCASQNTFAAAVAGKRPPVNLVIAVVSSNTRKGLERRMAIRQTWAARPGRTVVKFLLPPSVDAQVERAAFNDVAVFSGSVVQWAQKEATAPVQQDGRTRWQVADYLVKTTDDTFLVPHEIEKRLRLLPRVRTVWGVPSTRGGVDQDTWALSSDLFTSHSAVANVNDILRAGGAGLYTEKCGVYDHPLSRTAHAHGFITPADVQTIKNEVRYGVASSEVVSRGGATRFLSYSTVVNQMRRRRPLQSKAHHALASTDPLTRVAGLMEGAPPTLGGGGNFSAILPPASGASSCLSSGSCHMPLVGTRSASTSDVGATLAVRRVGREWLTTALALTGEVWREGNELRMI